MTQPVSCHLIKYYERTEEKKGGVSRGYLAKGPGGKRYQVKQDCIWPLIEEYIASAFVRLFAGKKSTPSLSWAYQSNESFNPYFLCSKWIDDCEALEPTNFDKPSQKKSKRKRIDRSEVYYNGHPIKKISALFTLIKILDLTDVKLEHLLVKFDPKRQQYRIVLIDCPMNLKTIILEGKPMPTQEYLLSPSVEDVLDDSERCPTLFIPYIVESEVWETIKDFVELPKREIKRVLSLVSDKCSPKKLKSCQKNILARQRHIRFICQKELNEREERENLVNVPRSFLLENSFLLQKLALLSLEDFNLLSPRLVNEDGNVEILAEGSDKKKYVLKWLPNERVIYQHLTHVFLKKLSPEWDMVPPSLIIYASKNIDDRQLLFCSKLKKKVEVLNKEEVVDKEEMGLTYHERQLVGMTKLLTLMKILGVWNMTKKDLAVKKEDDIYFPVLFNASATFTSRLSEEELLNPNLKGFDTDYNLPVVPRLKESEVWQTVRHFIAFTELSEVLSHAKDFLPDSSISEIYDRISHTQRHLTEVYMRKFNNTSLEDLLLPEDDSAQSETMTDTTDVTEAAPAPLAWKSYRKRAWGK